ncbi:MAG: oxidoreductase [Candidatus Pacebacteria bacterium]|nr:oxidoreductase [Candidatus Paceibacterota bacterium]
MLKIIDNFLNKITMYRLVLYFLLLLILVAMIFGFLGILPYNPLMLLASTLAILVVCYAVNTIFAYVFDAPTNVESLYITALILALIITPPESFSDIQYLIFIAWAAVWAMASKYILAIGKKHIFNPAAFAVVLTALTINQSASWWVSTLYMTPFILIGGLLITRKIKRFDLVLTFIFFSLVATSITHANVPLELPRIIWNSFVTSPLLFFAFVMLTEPLTTPPTKHLRMGYGAIVGAIFDPMVHIGPLFSTPELALVFGNIYSYIVSPKKKLILRLKEKIKVARDTYDFSFETDEDEFAFRPGQYFEWTLAHAHPDNRGNRRYFTIASTPVEEEIRMGVKFYPEPSSFKQALFNLKPGGRIVASQLSGDFTLPHNKKIKLCFIAGGIGVTPFESIITHMLERKQKRDVVMFYSNRTIDDIAYKNTFDKAESELGVRTIHVLSEEHDIPSDWSGEKGFINETMIKNKMPDYKDRMYFISGPHGMVEAFKDTLSQMGIPKSHIKVDFFPGFV